ncbi:MAG: divalent-cation tolerance protein CutA [Candidatus Diapherotrites archaeon]
MGLVIGYVTCKNSQEAEGIAKYLLEKKLIACANMVDKIESIYRWEGKIVNESEALLLLKTESTKINKVKKEIEKIHSNKIPCIEFIKVSDVNKNYEKWVTGELK